MLAVPMNHRKLLKLEQIQEFRKIIYHYFKEHGRDFPWRKKRDPYKVTISEVMLQQTQVHRVVEKYELFLQTFPDIESLAKAPLREILRIWRGLGYNRRALALKRLANMLVLKFGGEVPKDVSSLMKLPGIGNATANAIGAFAFNLPVVFAETNIRSVFIHHFFRDKTNISDAEILPLVAQTLDSERPREWYWALMDYGAALKKRDINPSRNSAHYQKQRPFNGSNRQLRGMILQVLIEKLVMSEDELIKELPFQADVVRRNVKQLEAEGFLVIRGEDINVA